ncbi:unnamed protein product, partial [Allacma fusca]
MRIPIPRFCLLIFQICYSLKIEKSYHISTIVSELTACVINILQITNPIDYSPIQTPFQINVFPNQGNFSTHKIKPGIFDFISESSKHARVFKESNLRCFAFLVIYQPHQAIDENTVPSMFDHTSEARNSKQRQILNWIENVFGDVGKISKLIVILRENSVPLELLKQICYRITTKAKFVPIFSIFKKTSEEPLTSGCYHRNDVQCEVQEDYYECRLGNCLESMFAKLHNVTSLGKKVAWTVFSATQFYIPQRKFIRPVKSRIPVRLMDTTVSFLLDDLNPKTGDFTRFDKNPHVWFGVEDMIFLEDL